MFCSVLPSAVVSCWISFKHTHNLTFVHKQVKDIADMAVLSARMERSGRKRKELRGRQRHVGCANREWIWGRLRMEYTLWWTNIAMVNYQRVPPNGYFDGEHDDNRMDLGVLCFQSNIAKPTDRHAAVLRCFRTFPSGMLDLEFQSSICFCIVYPLAI